MWYITQWPIQPFKGILTAHVAPDKNDFDTPGLNGVKRKSDNLIKSEFILY